MLDPSRHEPDRLPRLARAAAVCGATGKFCPAERATQLLEAIIQPGDRVAIEGDNQKQADFLALALAKVDPARVHDLHMVQSVLALPDHLAVFERGIVNRLMMNPHHQGAIDMAVIELRSSIARPSMPLRMSM